MLCYSLICRLFSAARRNCCYINPASQVEKRSLTVIFYNYLLIALSIKEEEVVLRINLSRISCKLDMTPGFPSCFPYLQGEVGHLRQDCPKYSLQNCHYSGKVVCYLGHEPRRLSPAKSHLSSVVLRNPARNFLLKQTEAAGNHCPPQKAGWCLSLCIQTSLRL